MARRAGWRITDESLRKLPGNIRDNTGAVGCEGFWGHGSDGTASFDLRPIHGGT